MQNFHSYLDSLKSTVDNATVQTKAEVPLNMPVNTPAPTDPAGKSLFSPKNILWTIGICIIGVSVVAFATQLTLLAINNIRGTTPAPQTVAITPEEKPENLYVRADLNKNIFLPDEASSTSTSTATSTVPDALPFDLGIPGVAKIGFDNTTTNQFLTDNINKYSESTLVIGGRQGELGGRGLIGGGDDDELLMQDRYSLLPKSAAPILSSKAYLVADMETGEIILEKNGEAIHPLASVSKLMTGVVAREKMDMQDIAIVSRDASRAYGGQGNLALGEKIRLADLQPPLLIESSNDAAEVFADHYGHSKFMEEMNKKAAELDMVDTYYGDPSGLDPKNTSTPRDLLKLARYIKKYDPQIYDITRIKQFSIKGHTWVNRNGLLLVSGFAGGKNGYIDQARQTTVSLFDVTLAKGGVRTVVVIILRSESKNTDVAKLLNYLKKAAVYEVR